MQMRIIQLYNLWARLALQDMYIDWGSVSAPLALPRAVVRF